MVGRPLEKIQEVRNRKVTFKKRRLGLIKKAMELTALTGTRIELKIYNDEDQSLIVFEANEGGDEMPANKNSVGVNQYAKFTMRHYEALLEMEKSINVHGQLDDFIRQKSKRYFKQLSKDLDGKNLEKLFSRTLKSDKKPDQLLSP